MSHSATARIAQDGMVNSFVMRRVTQALVIPILLIHVAAAADAPLHTVWMDIEIASCRAETFHASHRAGMPSTARESFTTTVVTGTVARAGYFPNPSAAAPSVDTLAGRIGQTVSLSVPDLPAGICQSVKHSVQRFAYTYHCDTAERKGRCLPPWPDAYLVTKAR
jgi:hypothetical protein